LRAQRDSDPSLHRSSIGRRAPRSIRVRAAEVRTASCDAPGRLPEATFGRFAGPHSRWRIRPTLPARRPPSGPRSAERETVPSHRGRAARRPRGPGARFELASRDPQSLSITRLAHPGRTPPNRGGEYSILLNAIQRTVDRSELFHSPLAHGLN